jgi:hypothetical protein
MDRRHVLLSLAAAPLAACETLDPAVLDGILSGQNSGLALSAAEVALGLKAALDNGVGNALTNVGVVNGFLGNDIIRIPLPQVLQDAQSFLKPIGADTLLVELQTQLNRGAEKAAPVAGDIFLDAIRGLTIPDAFDILRGADTAATEFLQTKTSARLGQLFEPIMADALNQTGALRLVDTLSAQMKAVPFGPNLGATARGDLIEHGVDYGLRGVFHFIGEEEKAIRANPAKRTSEILRRVFGA